MSEAEIQHIIESFEKINHANPDDVQAATRDPTFTSYPKQVQELWKYLNHHASETGFIHLAIPMTKAMGYKFTDEKSLFQNLIQLKGREGVDFTVLNRNKAFEVLESYCTIDSAIEKSPNGNAFQVAIIGSNEVYTTKTGNRATFHFLTNKFARDLCIRGNTDVCKQFRSLCLDVNQLVYNVLIQRQNSTTLESPAEDQVSLDFRLQEGEMRIKRMKLDIERLELDLQVKRNNAQVELLASGMKIFQNDPTMTVFCRDTFRNIVRDTTDNDNLRRLSISQVLKDDYDITFTGSEASRKLKSIGKCVSDEYLKQRGTRPEKHYQMVDGADRPVCDYRLEDLPIVKNGIENWISKQNSIPMAVEVVQQNSKISLLDHGFRVPNVS